MYSKTMPTRFWLLLVIGASSSVAIVWLAALMFAEVVGAGDQGRLAVIAALMFVAFLTLFSSFAARASYAFLSSKKSRSVDVTEGLQRIIHSGFLTTREATTGSDR